MIQYLDMTQVKGCFGVIPENGETIVFTGVSINLMPLSVKRKEGEVYADFAKKYGIHFIFDDDIPDIDFYSVPRLDIGAKDDAGGYIASVTEPFSLSDPIILIRREYRLDTKRSQPRRDEDSTFLTENNNHQPKLRSARAGGFFIPI